MKIELTYDEITEQAIKTITEFLTSSPTFALRDSGGGFPLVGDG